MTLSLRHLKFVNYENRAPKLLLDHVFQRKTFLTHFKTYHLNIVQIAYQFLKYIVEVDLMP